MLVCPAAFVTGAAPNVAEAPDAGAVKVTVSPGMGFPKASRTVTTSGAPAVPTVIDWPLPLVAVRLAGAPGTLVSAKEADVAPEACATTA